MSKILRMNKWVATVVKIEDEWVQLDVGNAFLARESCEIFGEHPLKIGDQFLVTNTMETLDFDNP